MSFFDKYRKTNKELDVILAGVANNAANNYKDAAQKYFKEFLVKFEELKASGKLNDKQLSFYEGKKSKYEKELKGFHH